MFILADVRPPWLEWASSMIMAKVTAPVVVANLVQDDRELLHRCDDDLLASGKESAQVAGVVSIAYCGRDLGKLLDCVADLPVEHPPVGNYDDGVEDGLAFPLQTDELVGEPGDGVALAAACRMLD